MMSNWWQLSFWAFAVVAGGGLLMAAMIAVRARVPSFMATAHGLGGLAALGLLAAANLRGPDTPELAWWALGAFASGLVGGLIFFRIMFRGRAKLPLALMHGSLGVLGLYLLYGWLF